MTNPAEQVAVFDLVAPLEDDAVRAIVTNMHEAEVVAATNRELVEQWLLVLIRSFGLALVDPPDSDASG
jgi:hypothetical protein